MAQAEILPAAKASFTKEVDKLVTQAEQMLQKFTEAAQQMLVFAENFKKLSDKARQLDKDDEEGANSTYLREKLEAFVSSSNPSIWSRWNTIGEFSPKLLPHAAALPAHRDTLYEVAKALKADEPVVQWIDQGKLDTSSTVRQVRSLRTGSSSTKREDGSVTVTIKFPDRKSAEIFLERIEGIDAQVKIK